MKNTEAEAACSDAREGVSRCKHSNYGECVQHISYQWITKQRLRKAGRIRPLVGLEEAKENNYSKRKGLLMIIESKMVQSYISF